MRFLLSLLIVPMIAFAAGKDFSVEYPPSTAPGELVFGVTYTVWIPDGVEKLRGVIVHQHGCGEGACKGGATAAYDLHWQALAKKWDCALLGPSYHQPEKESCRLWCDPRNGSAKTFLKCLTDLGQKSGHPELDKVPWCLWGHSGGGFWSSIMQTLYPERIAAIWFRSGTAFSTWEKGEIPKPEMPAAMFQIPMCCNPGAKENGDKRFGAIWTSNLAMFAAYRDKGAPIFFAPDPRTGHECGDSRYLAIPFFDACLALRLPEKNDQTGALKSVKDKGVTGPLIEAQNSIADKLQEKTNWYPSDAVMKACAEYVKTGAVGDTTPPPAPEKVAANATADGVEITWEAAADFESGIQQFIIEADGKEIGRVPAKPVAKFGRGLFQTMSFHDTPEAPLPAMKFSDKTAKAGEKHDYRVISVNSAGLKSDAGKTGQ